MGRPWWASVIQWTLWSIAMTVVMAWLGRSRSGPRPAGRERQLAHPSSMLIVGLACFLFFVGIVVVSNVYANNTTSVYTTIGFLSFAALGPPMIADYFFARHEVTDEGLQYGRMTGKRGSLCWDEVSQVRFARLMKWFVVKTDSGDVVRISVMLMGLPEFARAVLAHVRHTAIDPEARAILESTAQGYLPSIYG